MIATIENKNGACIKVDTKPILHPFCAKIICFFQAPAVLNFADQLRADNIPSDTVYLDIKKQPAGIIYVDYKGNKPHNDAIIETISDSFANFCENGNDRTITIPSK